jgi:hypothetical protein
MFVFGLAVMASELPASLAKTRFANATEAAVLLTFLLVFVVTWLMVGALGTYRLLFDAAGRELVTVDRTSLTLRRDMPLFTHVRTYDLREMQNLRALHSVVPFWVSRWYASSRYPWDIFGLTGGVIAFDYRGRTVRVGGGIDEAEAKNLVALLVSRFPSLGARTGTRSA